MTLKTKIGYIDNNGEDGMNCDQNYTVFLVAAGKTCPNEIFPIARATHRLVQRPERICLSVELRTVCLTITARAARVKGIEVVSYEGWIKELGN
jgi:hypothetical protein